MRQTYPRAPWFEEQKGREGQDPLHDVGVDTAGKAILSQPYTTLRLKLLATPSRLSPSPFNISFLYHAAQELTETARLLSSLAGSHTPPHTLLYTPNQVSL